MDLHHEQLARMELKLDAILAILKAQAVDNFIHLETNRLKTATDELAAVVAANQGD